MANFALPAHYRTWQFQVNKVIAAQATVLLSNARFVRFAKDAMLGTGAWTDAAGAGVASSGNWTLVSSCDGSGGAGSFGNNDGVDRWAADANLIWGVSGAANHSWAVLKQTGFVGGPYYLYLDCGINNSYQILYGWSKTLYTNGTANTAPTGPDIAQAGTYPLAGSIGWGGPTANAQNVQHVMKSSDGKATRIICCRGGWDSEAVLRGERRPCEV